MKRRALGKGLSSLIPETVRDPVDPGLVLLDLDRIQPSEQQPRVDFGSLDGLADSIRENGIVQPVVVRRDGNRFRLIAGERRWRAAQLAGLHKIPAVVRMAADDRTLELALIENIQRKDLNPMEEAAAYDALINQMKLSQAAVAKRVGRERSSVTNSLRLLKLPQKVQSLIRQSLISFGHAKVIMAIAEPEIQIKVADEVARRLLSVRETEALTSRLSRGEGAASGGAGVEGGAGTGANADPNVAAAAERLCRALATKVRIAKRGGRGKIEIEFYSDEELDRIYDFLLTASAGS